VADDAPFGLVVDRMALVAWATIEYSLLSTPKRTITPENLAAVERRDEHQLIRLRDIEQLHVHVLFEDSEHVREPASHWIAWSDIPGKLAFPIAPAV
jgi:hypothetical protein